jgi:putative holliday junction resolvase
MIYNPMIGSMKEKSKVIGLDVGDKRIGIAVSDALRLIAAPLLTVHRKNMKTDVASVLGVIRKEEAAEVVIGLPKNMDGTEGEQAIKVRLFAKQLARASKLPVHLEDERLSTFSAIEMLVEQGVKTGHNRDMVDMQAAAVILQGFLDRESR